ncbi:hypothetical protein N7492_007489 [Penicillium capsulatum]|uniref:Uncharacterized protein n=1 Tax=Penicillium capsulatum TaxID=69766 RepID=A0A9W9I002_9EURO|nr:hypothetical protein N7492_007489 [Penicillium capsulatum]KAJ6117323.1 hypothetical protein N7512_007048 [Penicillium capsulatum]
MLTEVLHLDNTHKLSGSSHEADIQSLIQDLPKRLRRARPSPLGWMKKKTSCGLCDLHRPMKPELVLEILQLIQQEVTTHFQQFDAYPELIQSPEANLLDRLRAIKGLWTKPDAQSSGDFGDWVYQDNGCAACVIARIAANPAVVCDLRVVLLSRTRTRRNPRTRSLTPFVEECIKRFGDSTAEELFGATDHVSLRMKAARKTCTRAWARDPGRKHSRRSRKSHRRRGASRTTHRIQQEGMNPCISNDSSSTAMIPDPADQPGNDNQEYSRSTLFLNLLDQVSSQPQNTERFDDLYGSIHDVLDLYGGDENGNPYSPKIDDLEAEMQDLSVDPQISKKRMRELSYAAVNGTLDEGTRKEMSQVLASSPLPPHLRGFGGQIESVDVPVVYQYSASDYGSEWTDDECEQSGSDYETPIRKSPSPGDTTWSLVCNQNNWI